MIHLLNATRMLDGKAIYRDYFQFTTPGTDSVYFCLFKLFGPHAWVPRAAFLALGTCLTWLTVHISRKVIDGWAALVPGLLLLVLPLRADPDGTHHWFSMLAVMAAIAVIIEKRSPGRMAAAGMLCGLAAWFTQGRGAVALLGLAAFLVWERHQKRQGRQSLLNAEASLAGAFVATLVATNAYFVWKAGWERFVYCTVTFGLRYYPADSKWNTLQIYMAEPPAVPPLGSLPALGTWLFVHALLPIVYVIFFFRYRHEASDQSCEPWDRLMLLNIMGLFLFAGVLPAPAYSRLCPISIPALILLVWLACYLRGIARAIVTAVCFCTVAVLGVIQPVVRQYRHCLYLNTPSGRIAYPKQSGLYEKQQWLMSRTRPSEYCFDALWAQMYFPLGLRNPTKVPYVTTSDYTRPEEVREVVNDLEKNRVQIVLWSLDLDMTAGDFSSGDHLEPLRDYLRRHYRVSKTFADGDQAWERSDPPKPR